MYKKRPIRFLNIIDSLGWKLKVYSISAKKDLVDTSFIESLESILPAFPQPSSNNDRYGVGFVILHEGNDGNYFVLCWWTGENMVASKIYMQSNPGEEHTLIGDNIISCVWELEVLYFEKTAWTETVLKNTIDADNIQAYLSKTFNGDI